jgi:hypothetical protein
MRRNERAADHRGGAPRTKITKGAVLAKHAKLLKEYAELRADNFRMRISAGLGETGSREELGKIDSAVNAQRLLNDALKKLQVQPGGLGRGSYRASLVAALARREAEEMEMALSAIRDPVCTPGSPITPSSGSEGVGAPRRSEPRPRRGGARGGLRCPPIQEQHAGAASMVISHLPPRAALSVDTLVSRSPGASLVSPVHNTERGPHPGRARAKNAAKAAAARQYGGRGRRSVRATDRAKQEAMMDSMMAELGQR